MKTLDTVRFALWTLKQKGVTRRPPERVEAIQQHRLRKLLRFAAERSAFYRRKYRGIDLGHCALADLPTTHKDELMERFDEVVTDPELRRADIERTMQDPDNALRKYQGKYALCHTSGSQGRPLIIVQDALALDVLLALQMTRGNIKRVGVREAVRHFFHPVRLAVIAMRRGFYPSAAAWEHMPAPAHRYLKVLRLGPTDPDLIEQLNAFQPNALTAYPSVLEMLVLHSDRLRLAPHLQQVVSNSEVLTDRARASFREAFGVPVLNNYATGECLCLSNGCPTDLGVHVNADWSILEVVDEHNRPVPPGRTGHKVLLTNLSNRVQPFIRYEVGDRVTMATAPCRCGNRLPRVERIDGRTGDYFWIRVGTGYQQLLNHSFKNAFDYVREAREWQAVQEDRNRIRVRVEPLPGTTVSPERALEVIRYQLDLLGLADVVDVEVDIVPRLETDAVTGKFRRIISRIGPPEDLEQSFTAAAALPAVGS